MILASLRGLAVLLVLSAAQRARGNGETCCAGSSYPPLPRRRARAFPGPWRSRLDMVGLHDAGIAIELGAQALAELLDGLERQRLKAERCDPLM